jgi:cell division protein FtsB
VIRTPAPLVRTTAARRTPFVLLVVVLLGSGLIALLLLNSSINQGSFELSSLQRQTTELTDEQQALQQEVDDLSAPNNLERQARHLGMVPGSTPAFLEPDGTVRGQPSPGSAESSTLSAPAPYLTPPAAATGVGVPAAVGVPGVYGVYDLGAYRVPRGGVPAHVRSVRPSAQPSAAAPADPAAPSAPAPSAAPAPKPTPTPTPNSGR